MLIVWSGLLLFLLSPLAQAACHVGSAIRPALQEVTEWAFLQKELPFPGTKGPTKLFATHFDYHSSVHAHWALLTMKSASARKRLREEDLRKELQFLFATPTFELPYGRAWLLLLLREWQKRNTASPVFAREVDQLEAELVAYLKWSGESELDSGSYRSTLTLLWLLTLSGAKDAETLESFRQKVIKDQRPPRDDFLSVQALRALLDPERAAVYQTPKMVLSESGKSGHQLGPIVSGLWPLAVKARKDRRACNTLRQNIHALEKQRNIWGSTYTGAVHWIPQFIWMSIWLARTD